MQPGQAICGAKTRKGTACKDIAMANGRCKRHGGKSSGPIKPSRLKGADNPQHKMGIYERYLNDEDKELYREAELGNVDHELRLVRIRLARTVRAREAWERSLRDGTGKVIDQETQGDDHRVLVELVDDEGITKDGDVLPVKKKIFKLPDFDAIEQRALARIESLEKTRKELLGDDPPNPDGSPPGSHNVTFSGGLGDDDEELPHPFAAKTP